MKHYVSLALCAVMVLAASGCSSQTIARPNWLNPGPAAYQQGRAHRFDPYPENDTGPAIAGGRPMEYDRPPAEPSRARWLPSWFR